MTEVLEVITNVLDYFDTVILDADARTVTPRFPDVTNEAKAKEICAALNRNYAGAPQLHITDQQRTLAAWMARALAAERHVAVLQEKAELLGACACGYDNPDDVCLAHSQQAGDGLAAPPAAGVVTDSNGSPA